MKQSSDVKGPSEYRQKLEIQSPDQFAEAKTPMDLEAAPLQPGGSHSVFSRRHIGLLAHIAAVGVIDGTVLGVIYAVLSNYLYVSATLSASATALARFPRSLRWIAALFSDCYPIFGYSRRPYLILGWTVSLISCFLMAVLPLGDPYYLDPSLSGKDESKMTEVQLSMINHNATHRGVLIIVLLMFTNLGYVIAFGASDGVVVELAQREPEAIRGTVQNHATVVRQAFTILSTFMTGIGLNSAEYGGSFSWTMGFNAVMGACAFFAFITTPICWFCISEVKTEVQSMRSFFLYLYDIMQDRVIFQMVAFRFCSQICLWVSVTASNPIQSTWAKVEPLNDSIAGIITSGATIFALFVTRKWGLHWSWQVVTITVQAGVVFIDAIPTFLTTWDVITISIGVYISALFVVEVCDVGKEATLMSLMVSISSVARPFATVLTKSIDSNFDIERKYIVKDENAVKWQVAYAYIIAYAFNLFSIVFVMWLPRQKKEACELKKNGGRDKWMGIFTIFYITFSLAWMIMTNILSLSDSTKCLRIAGGNGCHNTK